MFSYETYDTVADIDHAGHYLYLRHVSHVSDEGNQFIGPFSSADHALEYHDNHLLKDQDGYARPIRASDGYTRHFKEGVLHMSFPLTDAQRSGTQNIPSPGIYHVRECTVFHPFPSAPSPPTPYEQPDLYRNWEPRGSF